MTPEQEKQMQDAATALEVECQRPVFFAKLAAAGISPQTDEEANELWDLGCDLLVEHDGREASRATSNASFYKQAREDLHRITGASANQDLVMSQQLVESNPDLLKAAHLLLQHQNTVA